MTKKGNLFWDKGQLINVIGELRSINRGFFFIIIRKIAGVCRLTTMD